MPGIFINSKEVVKIYGCTVESARDKILLVKKIIGRKPYKKITIREFCEIEDIPMQDVLKVLQPT